MSHPPAWIDITARDAARARGCYNEFFGWEIEESPQYSLVKPRDGELPGGIGEVDPESPHPAGLVIYLAVDDLDAALARADRVGAPRLVPPWEIPGLGRMGVISDPDGNRIGLWQR